MEDDMFKSWREVGNDTNEPTDLSQEILQSVYNDSFVDVQRLIEYGCDINRIGIVDNEEPIAPLSLACMRGNVEIVRLLIQSNCDLNISGHDGKTPLHYTCEGDERREENKINLYEILTYLINAGANIEAKNNMGCTPLFTACEVDDVNMVKLLVRANCNVNIQTVNGDSPIKVACRNAKFWTYYHGREMISSTSGHSDPNNFPPVLITKQLLQANANISEATLLPTAVQFGDEKLVKELLALGMDINMLDDNMCTPLGSACSCVNVRVEVVKLLLDHGADVDRGGGWRKQKPIIFAYVHNSVDKIRLLLSHGAKITPEEMTELVSLSFSKSILENPEIVHPWSKELLSWQLLLAAGFQPFAQDPTLASKLNQLSMCSSYDKIIPWIWVLLTPLRSLRDLCRIVIRNNTSKSIDDNINFLPLPKELKKFLQFQEFST